MFCDIYAPSGGNTVPGWVHLSTYIIVQTSGRLLLRRTSDRFQAVRMCFCTSLDLMSEIVMKVVCGGDYYISRFRHSQRTLQYGRNSVHRSFGGSQLFLEYLMLIEAYLYSRSRH